MIFKHDGIAFNYQTLGDGPAVVFTHGLGGALSQPLELVGMLPGRRLVTWDCRGHGITEPLGPDEKFTFQTFAADLAGLLDHLEIERAVIGGISMGAAVAVRLALDRPSTVSGLVLVRPAWLDRPEPPNLHILSTVARLLRERGTERGLAELETLPEFQQILADSADSAESLRQQFNKPGAVARCVRLERMPRCAPIDDWAQVKRLTMPALVVGNRPDASHPFAFAQEWARRLPQGELVEIPAKSAGPDRHRAALGKALHRFLEVHPC